MLRTCGKRLIVAMAAVAAVIGLGAGPDAKQLSQKTPLLAQIVVSEKSVVYIQIQGRELRAAMSVEGLQTAAPVKGRGTDASSSPYAKYQFTLPVPVDQLPAGITAIKENLTLAGAYKNMSSEPEPYIISQLTISRTDDQRAEWQYISNGGAWPGQTWEKAPLIKSPDLDKVKASLEAKLPEGKLTVGLRITAGDAQLTDVHKDGEPVQVKVVVADATGAEVASRVGGMTDFVFS